MRYVIETGTDAGSLLLFDPAALPADFDRRLQNDPVEIFESLSRVGKAFWIDTDGDGRYLLHAYVDEPIPATIWAYLHDPETAVSSFRFPRASFTPRDRNLRFASSRDSLRSTRTWEAWWRFAPELTT